MKALPNAITIGGLAALCLGAALSARSPGVAALLWFVALGADALDGWTARRIGAVSDFGAALDRIGDVVAVHLVGMTLLGAWWFAPAVPVLVVQTSAVVHRRDFSGRALALFAGINVLVWLWAVEAST